MKNKIIIILIAVIIFLLSLALFIVSSQKTANEVDVTIKIAPSDSIITIDNKINAKNGTVRLSPGKHSFVFKREGFIEVKDTITVYKTEPNLVIKGLTPNSAEGDKYVNQHPKEYEEIGQIGDQEAERTGILLTEKNPLILDLPADVSPQYRIDYGVSVRYPDDQTKIAIYISSASAKDKSNAIQIIYDLGYDPSDYEIIFREM